MSEDPKSASLMATPSATTDNETSGTEPPKDRHEPRGRKPNDHLPPSRAREVQRAFRLRRAEHLAALEERIALLETENGQLRALLSLPEADRAKIGSGPTGRGKSLKDGGVPMSERVRARKEARARERAARGIVEPESSDHPSDDHDSVSPSVTNASLSIQTLTGGPGGNGGVPRDVGAGLHTSPLSATTSHLPSATHTASSNNSTSNVAQIFGAAIGDIPAPFAYGLPNPFPMALSPDHTYDYSGVDFGKSQQMQNNSFSMFNLFDTTQSDPSSNHGGLNTSGNSGGGVGGSDLTSIRPSSKGDGRSPAGGPNQHSHQPSQPSRQTPTPNPSPDLLSRLRQCCHVSDSHVVNDPGLLIFATRLCQSVPCGFGAAHLDSQPASDAEYLSLDDAWKALRSTLDPGGDADGENRMNTGRIASELVTRASASRGNGSWIVCRYREGLSIRRSLVAGLVSGFGGKFE